ncbi:recombinase family protein [Thiothrix lacustris]|uniref:recombinase family protein n=1 Tax=Thiothrix lacustris TaxID=525917 RepID=UPI0027E41C96|nr:recombinase family protein [Thiothrix lacustris]WMP17325.1 recombinase family protein [Thiothrix lacustris]
MNIGYARVSTSGQSLEIQMDKLHQQGCEKLFREKKSGGSRIGRTELEAALEFVREGDVLVVTRLDRLARSMHDLVQVTQELERKHVGLVVLEQELNTTTAAGKLLFHMLGAVAEFERSLINERIAEGVTKAKAAGVKFGRKEKLTVAERESLRQEFNTPGVSKAELAKKYRLHRSSLYRLAQDTKN